MHTALDWMVVGGFFLLLAGLGLRVTLMMRGNDAVPTSSIPVAGHAAVNSFRAANPGSKWPFVVWVAITIGLILLIAGIALEFHQ